MLFLIFMFLTRQCLGVSNISILESRIVQGYKVGIYQYPHSVFLHFEKDRPSACGSSLITDQAVITAAHCLSEMKLQGGKITAFLGATIPLDAVVKRNVVLYKIHPKNNLKTGKFNLGIGFFDKPVLFSKELQKIPIIQQRPQADDALYTSGWGKQIARIPGVPMKLPDYSDMRHLKASKQRVTSEQECHEITGCGKSPALWCTISINGYHYHGDSGNGLVDRRKKSCTLVGVVNYMVNDITVYSDVIREQLWINDTIVELIRKFCKEQKYPKKKKGIRRLV